MVIQPFTTTATCTAIIILTIATTTCHSFTIIQQQQQQQQQRRFDQPFKMNYAAGTRSMMTKSHKKLLLRNHVRTPTSTYAKNTNNDHDKKKRNEIENQMLDLHKEQSQSLSSSSSSPNSTKSSSLNQHLQHQKQMFDNLSSFFNSYDATPPEVQPLLSFIIQRVLHNIIQSYDNQRNRIQIRKGNKDSEATGGDKIIMKQMKILDVGCGVGALFPFYLQEANKLNVTLDIVGVDLSSNMIKYAKDNSNSLLLEMKSNNCDDNDVKHDFNFEQGDFVQMVMGEGYGQNNYNEGKNDMNEIVGFDFGIVNYQTSKHRGQYDAVVINACFGNFYDQGMG